MSIKYGSGKNSYSMVNNLFSRTLYNTILSCDNLSENKTSSDIPLVSGCCMFTDTKSLKQVGGFDEGYFLYFEDFDLSIRVSKFGKLMYAPEVRITHSGGYASSKGLWHIWKFCISGARFFNTHGWRYF